MVLSGDEGSSEIPPSLMSGADMVRGVVVITDMSEVMMVGAR